MGASRSCGLSNVFARPAESCPAMGRERSEVGLQKGAQLAKRFAAVADRGLAVAGFGERHTVRWKEEDRVVAEAAVASRFWRDASLDRASCLEENPVAAHQRQRTYESGRAVDCRARAERRVDQRELLGIRRPGAA